MQACSMMGLQGACHPDGAWGRIRPLVCYRKGLGGRSPQLAILGQAGKNCACPPLARLPVTRQTTATVGGYSTASQVFILHDCLVARLIYSQCRDQVWLL